MTSDVIKSHKGILYFYKYTFCQINTVDLLKMVRVKIFLNFINYFCSLQLGF